MIRSAALLLLWMTILTGGVYPVLVTGITQALFVEKANGSLIRDGDIVRGSRLIGQTFSDGRYFWGRPSATSPTPYNAAASSGSNLGPTNPALKEAIVQRVKSLQSADPGNARPVPIDLVTSSGSGLDPHISPAAALYQVSRVARYRGISEDSLCALVTRAIEPRTFGFLGEARVNVLELNLALDQFVNNRSK
jgi:K+-transporting ATPase ATPase C chain